MFDSCGAHSNIWINLLDKNNALYSREFEDYFRLSQPRVERMLLQDFGRCGDTFYQRFRVNMCGRVGPSLEAKVLLPLATIAYGDHALHSLRVTYQVSQSRLWLARKIYRVFFETIQKIYGDEYMRTPTATDLKAICTLHWIHCPMEWQGVFRSGREKNKYYCGGGGCL